MRRLISWLAVALICAISSFAAGEDGNKTALKVGIVPFTSPTSIFNIHKPIKEHLEKKLGINVKIYTSKNHEMFLEDSLNRRFDIIFTTAHFAPFLREAGFAPSVAYSNDLDLILVSRKESNITSLKGAKYKRIGVPDYLSLYHIVGFDMLDKLGAADGIKYIAQIQASHASGIHAVDIGKIDAVITGTPPYKLTEEYKKGRLIAFPITTIKVPSIMIMVDEALGEEALERITRALLEFQEQKAGKQFFSATGYGGFKAISKKDISGYDSYKPIVEKLLKDKK